MHIDDFLNAGSQSFLETVVNKITEMYKVAFNATDIFNYIGLQVTNTDSKTTVSPGLYIGFLKDQLIQLGILETNH